MYDAQHHTFDHIGVMQKWKIPKVFHLLRMLSLWLYVVYINMWFPKGITYATNVKKADHRAHHNLWPYSTYSKIKFPEGMVFAANAE